MKSNYQLILRENGLTKDNYRQLYNSLIKDELIDIPFNLNYIDNVIRRLKYLSKSAKKTFLSCPLQFKYVRILKQQAEKDILTYFDVYGRNLHMVCDKVWDKLNINKIINSKSENKIRDYIYSECIKFIPEYEKKLKIYTELLWNYAEYEAYRITEIINTVGRDKCKKYIIPVYRELEVENHEIHESGKLDIIHRLITDEFAIADYKFGRPKYYEWSWNPNIDITEVDDLRNYDKNEIDFELGSYYNLVLDIKNVYKTVKLENGRKKLVDLEYMDFKKGLVLYLKDWRNTFHYISLSDDMIMKVNNVTSDIIETINSGKFLRKFYGRCFEYCGFIDLCLQSKEVKNKFYKMDRSKKKLLDNIFLKYIED